MSQNNSKYAVSVYEIDLKDHKYNILDEFSRAFDSYEDAVKYARTQTIKCETYIRGYLINEVICCD